MKIVFLDEATISLDNDIDFSSLEALGELVLYPNSTSAEALERAKGASNVIVNKVLMTSDVIAGLPQLKHIAVIATGYNNVDLKAASKHGVRVTNVSGYAKHTVPQHTMALILNLATRAHQYDADIKAGFWQESSSFTLLTYPTFELAGKTLGIVGFGAIGRGLARIAKSFDMRVIANSRRPFEEPGVENCTLEQVLTQSDIVSLHCPLTDSNKGMIDKAALALMKPQAILINTARGGLVDEQALADALNSGQIAGAGIDTLGQEPPRDGSPLLGDVKNLIITPHSAWSTKEARQRLIDEVAKNIQAFSEGRQRNVVNL